MTWTTLGPDGALIHVWVSLVALIVLALAYALYLLYRVIQLHRLGQRMQDEGLEEDQEGEEP